MAHDFDFWLGTWDARWDGGHGANVVTAELDGSVILERFDAPDLRGISVSVHDGTEWRQTWVDSQQSYIDLRGGSVADGMELLHEHDDAQFRMRFTEIETDSFVWLWERLENGSWNVRWRIDYTRHA